jgi:Ras GTPase-activating-like protein IQGAP2/3
MSVTTMLAPSTRNSASSTSSGYVPVSRQNTIGSSEGGTRSVRASKRYSVTALYLSMSAQDRDLEIEDELARGWSFASLFPRTSSDDRAVQKTLRDLKSKISSQSKKNFVLEKDVRYLDSRIALLIQNRMALEEVSPC